MTKGEIMDLLKVSSLEIEKLIQGGLIEKK